MINSPTPEFYTRSRLVALVLLRVAIGWHFMYEGLAKIMHPSWSSLPYLMDSKGIFSGFFQSLAMNPTLLAMSDFLMTWSLTILGFMLIVGFWSRIAKLGAIGLLFMFYISQPPLLDAQYVLPGEGNYIWVNKNLIELLALVVLYLLPTGHIIGVGRFFRRK